MFDVTNIKMLVITMLDRDIYSKLFQSEGNLLYVHKAQNLFM